MRLPGVLRWSAVLTVVCSCGAGGRQAAAAGPERPNVLLIISDDQSLDTFGFLRAKALTPAIDRLAAEGVYFSRAYASTSVCTPSRFTCLTGRYASRCRDEKFAKHTSPEGQTDVQWNTSIGPDEPNVAAVLQAAGYATGIVGKWHNGPPDGWARSWQTVPADGDPADPTVAALLSEQQGELCDWLRGLGFGYAAGVNCGNLGSHPCRALRQHNQDWITKAALDFVDQNRDRPFFLCMATTLMHGPSPLASLKSDPRITHAGLLDAPLDVQPSRQSVLERAAAAGVPDELAPATWLDDGIQAVLRRLDALGLDQRTLVIFFNDHGVEQGKGSCYEGGVRTPLVIRWKGRIKPARCDALVQNIDFVPTILDACGVDLPQDMRVDGTSLLPLMDGRRSEVHDSLFFEIGHTRAVCTKQWKYLAFRIPPSRQLTAEQRRKLSEQYAARKKAREDQDFRPTPDAPLSHLGFPGGQGTERSNAVRRYAVTYYDPDQLYDLENDPGEKNNLADTVRFRQVLREMQARLQAHLAGVPGSFAEFKPQ